MGNKPAVVIWELGTECSAPVAQLRGHQFGIAGLAFSPDSKYLISAGFQQDGFLHFWEWRSGKSIASAKVATKVSWIFLTTTYILHSYEQIFGVTFCDDGNNFITCGSKHLKFWQLRITGQGTKVILPKGN